MVPFTTFVDFFSESLPQPALFSERCLRTRLNINQCQRCVESCPFGALSINNRTVALDTTRCTGCMSCVAACPQDALASDNDLDEMLSSFPPERDVVVSCIRQAQNHPDEITLPCVGILSKPVLAAIMLSGSSSVTFNLVQCAECCNRSVAAAFLVASREIMQELSDINVAKVVLLEKEEHLAKQKMDRRSYLTKIRDIVVAVSNQRFLSKQVPLLDELKTSRRIPFKTQLVRKLLSNSGDSRQKILALFGHTLTINANCNCCPLCKGICPTGALKIYRSDQGKSLKFEMLDCNGCGLCVEFCKKNALSLKRVNLECPDLN